jgi:hypothetical protein
MIEKLCRSIVIVRSHTLFLVVLKALSCFWGAVAAGVPFLEPVVPAVRFAGVCSVMEGVSWCTGVAITVAR